MSYCERCGFPLPEGSEFCPSCGTPVKRKAEVAIYPRDNIAKILQSGVTGAFLSLLIYYTLSAYGNISVYFFPSFISSLLVVYFSKTSRLSEAVGISLAVYLFADAMNAGIALGFLSSQGITLAEAYGDYVPTMVDVIMYTANPITAVIAGYLGAKLNSKARVKEPSQIIYERREEPGGVIYCLKRILVGPSSSSAHKV